tara:strand:- start:996 stop:1370 length:375 start_codon:yes stop_codon:yes gene_type:complete
MAKTKLQVARMRTKAMLKKYDKYTLPRLETELTKLEKKFKIDPAPGTKIDITVVKRLMKVRKLDKMDETRKQLKKTVPTTKKKVSKAEFEKAKTTLQKKVPKGSHRMPDGSIMKDSAMKKKTSY